MSNFCFLKDISLKDKSTWENKIFLTIDVDWASDFVIENTLKILKKHNIKSTIFVTHNSNLINKCSNEKLIDLGIHPNLNFLINGDFRYGKNYKDVIDGYMKIVPSSKVCRFHSLAQSAQCLSYLSDIGLTHESNICYPYNAGTLEPFMFSNNKLIRVPYFWEDDTHCLYNHKYDFEIFSDQKLKVFDFHPIHIFLNTEDIARYEKAKNYLNDEVNLQKFVNYESYGTRDFLLDLISEYEN